MNRYQKQIKTIDKYIKSFPKEVGVMLQTIREIVNKEAPKSVEVISYNMPGFKLDGRILLYFAGYKKHISIYPYPTSVKSFAKDLLKYKTSKSTIQFQLDQKLPVTLIRKIVQFRIRDLSKNK